MAQERPKALHIITNTINNAGSVIHDVVTCTDFLDPEMRQVGSSPNLLQFMCIVKSFGALTQTQIKFPVFIEANL